jgi:hypothetical protein
MQNLYRQHMLLYISKMQENSPNAQTKEWTCLFFSNTSADSRTTLHLGRLNTLYSIMWFRYTCKVHRLVKCKVVRESADSRTAHLSYSNAHLVRRPTSQRLCIWRVVQLAKCKVVISESGIRLALLDNSVYHNGPLEALHSIKLITGLHAFF